MSFILRCTGIFTVCLFSWFASTPALANDVAGVKLESTISLGGKTLKLNGAGVRVKFFSKIYVAGLYLAEEKKSTAEIIAIAGPKRIALTMLRELSSEQLSQAFLDGVGQNSTKDEKIKIMSQLISFGKGFTKANIVKKGDVITLDWLPSGGTIIQLNGTSLMDPLPGVEFYEALLKIWLGDKPVDAALKKKLLSETVE